MKCFFATDDLKHNCDKWKYISQPENNSQMDLGLKKQSGELSKQLGWVDQKLGWVDQKLISVSFWVSWFLCEFADINVREEWPEH